MYEDDANKANAKKVYMQSGKTLKRLADAVKDGTVNTSADVVVLITALDLADKENGKVDNGVMGVAYVTAVCNPSLRAALAEDHAYTFSTVGLTAHELAHAGVFYHRLAYALSENYAMNFYPCNINDLVT
ncbi:hypothetical protein IscW_ISCW010499 [Ixodes scapularis]|uniref:Uncharacterized protein n=1 Tax=Ixodes scapularis TaxID=6945 RepID=B7Q492_IXOSC|nr:hypothetical protein IscW_ISCW010499 [Ixodes scapularis]|eukprot:XP_002399979.1 hypothetical protein IscW_ISCW010499 [Ixodes scapularis]